MEVNEKMIQEVVQNIYDKYCRVMEIIGKDGLPLAWFPVDVNEPVPFTADDIRNNGWKMNILDSDIREFQGFNYLTNVFWTCDCMEHNVHHITDSSCLKCSSHWKVSSNKIPILNIQDLILMDSVSDTVN